MVHSAEVGSIPVADMSALIALLEASETGSYVLDEIVIYALCKSRFRTCIAGLPDDQGGLWMYEFDGHAPSSALRVTQSLDAALALAERVLPGKFWTVYAAYRIEGRMTYGVNLDDDSDTSYSKTPALALCIAILKAKAQGEGG